MEHLPEVGDAEGNKNEKEVGDVEGNKNDVVTQKKVSCSILLQYERKVG